MSKLGFRADSSALRGIAVCLAVAAVGCAYPRRSTSLAPAREGSTGLNAPSHVWQLRFISATIPPRRRGGMDWDDDGSRPDPFIRLHRGTELVWESETRRDALDPAFNQTLPRNIRLPPSEELRIELWDSDGGPSNDPIGVWRGQGLPPNALPDADARINLEGGAALMFRVLSPRPHRGVGIELYEVRGDELLVLEVIDSSPAGRAGIERGDRIVAIGGQAVDDMTEAQAASAISMAADRQQSLTVKKPGGQQEQVDLDRGYVWLIM